MKSTARIAALCLTWTYVLAALALAFQTFMGMSMVGFKPPIHPLVIALLVQPFALIVVAFFRNRWLFQAVSAICFALTAALFVQAILARTY